MWLLLALGALVAGGVVWHEKAKAGTAIAPLLTPASFDGLAYDHVYRVWARLAAGYGEDTAYDALERDLSNKMEALGFSKVMLANEDPADPKIWTFIARWGREAPGAANVAPLGIYTLEEIADMPISRTYPAPPPAVLDTGLSFAEANAVKVALAKEVDVSRLYSFAQTLTGDFPVSQSLLQAKADILVKPVTSHSSEAFSALQAAGTSTITSMAAAPMAQAALLAYRAGVTRI
jgi:hypothetical protein